MKAEAVGISVALDDDFVDFSIGYVLQGVLLEHSVSQV
jgi:hypothetical protein